MGDTERPPDRRGDDGKDRKVFVGGLNFDADEAQLRQDFGKFGDIEDIFLPRDRDTQKPRGFGFVTFADESVVPAVLKSANTIDGRVVDVKRAVPRDRAPPPTKLNGRGGGGGGGGGGGYDRSGSRGGGWNSRASDAYTPGPRNPRWELDIFGEPKVAAPPHPRPCRSPLCRGLARGLVAGGDDGDQLRQVRQHPGRDLWP